MAFDITLRNPGSGFNVILSGNQKSLSVTSTGTLSLRRNIGIPRNITEISTILLRRIVGKPLPKITEVAVLSNLYGLLKSKALSVTMTASNLLRRNIGKPLSVTESSNRLLRRQINKPLPKITETSVLTILHIFFVPKVLAIIGVFNPLLRRRTGKTLPKITETSITGILRQLFLGKILAVTMSGIRSLRRMVGKPISITEYSTVGLRRIVGIIRAVTEYTILTVRKQFTKFLSVIEIVTVKCSTGGETFFVVLSVTAVSLVNRTYIYIQVHLPSAGTIYHMPSVIYRQIRRRLPPP